MFKSFQNIDVDSVYENDYDDDDDDDDSSHDEYIPVAEDLAKQREVDINILPENLLGLLEKFYHFLVSPDGGKKNERTAKQMKSEIRYMLAAISASTVEDMFQGTIIRDRYLMEYCIGKKLSPESVKKYLISLGDFLGFLIVDQIPLNGVTRDDIIALKTKSSYWKKMYKSLADKKFWVKQLDDYENLVSPEHLEKYQSSEIVMETLKLFDICKNDDNYEISGNDFWKMRDHLFVCIHFSNGHRAGVSANFMLHEYERAKYINDHYIMHVLDHKTVKTAGPAMITLTPEQFALLQIYITKVRSRIRATVSNVFVSWTGLKLESGQVIIRYFFILGKSKHTTLLLQTKIKVKI